MSDEQPIRYAVRYSTRARRDFDFAVADYNDYTGDERRAAQLYQRIDDTAMSLGELPDRYAVAEQESAVLGFTVRRVLARLSRNSVVAYHLLYYAVEQSDDGPRVTVVHIRHASRAPMTADEARDIKAQQ